ncbi:MAG: DUF898 domain-containing protein [Alphaproteobacteria bacterium]|nr:MAG: DUF898 domain-containing protein [Alphaproteobacteria bacterium]
MNQMAVVPPALPGSVSFSGKRGDFRALVTRGALLELVTVGFYRFWLTTDIRRHLWSDTTVDDDAFEYTGRGKELLIGFLFALAIIVPVYLAYFLISVEAARFKAFASFPLLAFFYLFGQFAIYRARRYRLTRTVWRGVRFWMTGSGWAYAAYAALWGVLVGLTLGLMLPWREAALERYKMRHTHYGDLQGSFEGRGWDFFKRGWWLWLLAPVALYVFPLAPFVYAAFKAVEWRWWLSGMRFGGVRLESTLPRGALIGLYWKVIGWIVLLALAFVVYLAICAGLVASMSAAPLNQFFAPQVFLKSIPLLVLAGIGYLAFALAINVVIRIYLLRDLWVRVLASTNVHGMEAAANVSAKGELASALGEGIADGLDVAGF